MVLAGMKNLGEHKDMKMNNWVILLGLITSLTANASSSRVITADTISATGGASLSVPSTGAAIISDTASQTLTNKTLTAPVLNSPTGLVKADVGLSNVDNTSDATKNSATATLTNKTLTAPVINSPTGIVKADVGLGNVDNTSDATKNSATATLTNKTIDYNSNTILNLPSVAPSLSGSASSPNAITAAGGVTFAGSNYNNITFIESNGGAVTVTATPSITNCTLAGQQLTLIGESATNTVTLQDNAGLSGSNLQLNGNITLGLNSIITLVCDAAAGKWVESSRR